MATPIYPLVDRILDGHLERELRERRAAGDSLQSISRWLYADHKIEVTAETVRKWCTELGLDTSRASADTEPAA